MAKLCPQQTSSTAWPSDLRFLRGPFVSLPSLLQQNQEAGLAPIFNKEQVREEVAAQVAITQEAGKRLPKFVGD